MSFEKTLREALASEPLLQWQWDVRRHLDLIAVAADMCARHADELALKPDFETVAECNLNHCERVLANALTDVRRALEIYRSKPATP